MKNIVFLLFIFFLGLSPSALVLAQTATSPATSSEATIEQLQSQIKSLLTQIEELKSQVETVKTELKFTKALQRGMTGEEVKELQEFLKKFPDIYPEGLVTGYFGPLTEAAVKKLQEKQGIEQVGNVGPKTLNKLNELISEGAGASGVVPPGLLTAPGIQKKIESPATVTLPATPATPAVPAQPTATATPAIPAIPATPAIVAAASATSTATTDSLIKIIASQLPQKPWDVAVSGSDYIVTVTDLDKSTGRLLRITADGKVSTIASLNRRLAGVAISGSNYYVLDGDTNVLKISSDGTVSTILTLVTSGIGTGAYFQNDIAVSNSDLIITDYAGGRLLRIASTTKAVSMIASGLNYITSVIVDGSDFVVLYGGAQNLSRVTPKGQITQITSLAEKVSGHSSVTKIGSDFYVNSGFSNTIARVSANGTATLLPIPNENYDFISLANNGSEIIATDYDNYRLLRINPSAPIVAAPSGTVPAVPAIPATPATPATSAAPATSATPATSAAPAPTTSTIQTTTTSATSLTATSSATTTSSTSTTITTTSDTTPPSAPTGFSAFATSSSQINLSWTASTDNVGVTGYKVYRNGAFLTNATLNFYWDTGLTASTNYSYTVAAYDAAGNLSAQSNSASVATQSGTGTCPGLNLTFQDNKTSYISGYWIEYTWTCTPSGSASYVEIQVVKSDGTATTVHSSSGNTKTLEFQSSTFGPGNYTLRACFTAGCSSIITSLPFTITAPCTESWTCGNWSSCSNSTQTRTCTDTNNCGTTNNIPVMGQSCTTALTFIPDTSDGYGSWQTAKSTCESKGQRLPTRPELDLLYMNQTTYGLNQTEGDTNFKIYWSSEEIGSNAYYTVFSNGFKASGNKDYSKYFRCVKDNTAITATTTSQSDQRNIFLATLNGIGSVLKKIWGLLK